MRMDIEKKMNHERLMQFMLLVSQGPDRGLITQQSKYYVRIKENFEAFLGTVIGLE
jgi:hypothetical protein